MPDCQPAPHRAALPAQGARTAARVALQRLRETAEGRPEGQPVLLAQKAAGWGGCGLHSFSAVPAAAAGVGEMMSAGVVRRSVAALACSPPQVQLGEVQMLSRVAASEHGVQLIVAAQGVHALLGCLAQNLGPGGSGPPEGQAVVAAVLGTLGTLCRQDAGAAGSVAATLATLAQQPDARSMQLAAALRGVLPSREGAPASPFTPPSHKQQQRGGQEAGGSATTLSPYSVLLPPGTAGSVLSTSGPGPPAAPRCGGGSASPPCSTASSGPQHNGPSGQRGESGSSGGGGTPRKSVFVFTSESAVHFVPSHASQQQAQGQGQGQRPPRHPGGGQLGLWDAELARQLAACDLGSGGSQLRWARVVLLGLGSRPAAERKGAGGGPPCMLCTRRTAPPKGKQRGALLHPRPCLCLAHMYDIMCSSQAALPRCTGRRPSPSARAPPAPQPQAPPAPARPTRDAAAAPWRRVRRGTSSTQVGLAAVFLGRWQGTWEGAQGCKEPVHEGLPGKRASILQ